MQRLADLVSTTRHDPTRYTCFVSYHDADFSEVEWFIRQFGDQFVPLCIGVTEQDTFVESLDESYIKSRIRDEKLGDSTVTIILLGRETWHQKFVDWEIAASLLEGPTRPRNGILAIPLPSMNNRAILPERLCDNFFGVDKAVPAVIYESYPTTRESFRAMLDRAHASRSRAGADVDDIQPLRRKDSR